MCYTGYIVLLGIYFEPALCFGGPVFVAQNFWKVFELQLCLVIKIIKIFVLSIARNCYKTL